MKEPNPIDDQSTFEVVDANSLRCRFCREILYFPPTRYGLPAKVFTSMVQAKAEEHRDCWKAKVSL